FQISTRGDYGLLLLSELARELREGREHTSLRAIAESKNLSLKYLGEIATTLKKAGLITSKEGRDGGYTLARQPEEITMIEALEILEGPVSPVRCCDIGEDKCGVTGTCTVKSTWVEATDLVTNFLKNKTIADTLNSPSA
ncbi:transcriptional regulator, partial [Candidatus Peregrinibacteria bacterium CG_4_9_14_0_2_um_filter_53_11]